VQYTVDAVREAQRALQHCAAARCAGAAQAALRLLQHGARWSVLMNIYAQACCLLILLYACGKSRL